MASEGADTAPEMKKRDFNREHSAQKMGHLDIALAALSRWQCVGISQGLASDTEIAYFLLQT